jgi:hypothetical protein
MVTLFTFRSFHRQVTTDLKRDKARLPLHGNTDLRERDHRPSNDCITDSLRWRWGELGGFGLLAEIEVTSRFLMWPVRE